MAYINTTSLLRTPMKTHKFNSLLNLSTWISKLNLSNTDRLMCSTHPSVQLLPLLPYLSQYHCSSVHFSGKNTKGILESIFTFILRTKFISKSYLLCGQKYLNLISSHHLRYYSTHLSHDHLPYDLFPYY